MRRSVCIDSLPQSLEPEEAKEWILALLETDIPEVDGVDILRRNSEKVLKRVLGRKTFTESEARALAAEFFEPKAPNFVQLDDELTTVEGYLELQLLRFPGKFDYKIVLEGIERDSLNFIPPMLIQPMIENCIEHGFANIDYKGLITITLSKGREGFLFCSIKDNGVGIPVDRIDYSKAKSTKLIDSFLKKLTPSGLSLSNNTARTPGEKGALVEFLIPCKNAPNG